MSRRLILIFYALFFAVTVLGQQPPAQTVAISNDKIANTLALLRNKPVDSKTIEDAVETGFALIAAGHFQEALTIFTSIIDLKPADYRAVYGSALAAFNLGQTAFAEERVRSAIEMPLGDFAPQARYGKADGLVLLGVILAVKGDNRSALSALTEATKIAPGSFDAQFALGRALYGAGDPQNAALAFEKAVALNRSDVKSRFFLATALEAAGKYEAAQKIYSDLIAMQPNKADGYLGLGVLLVKLGGDKAQQGIEVLRKAVSIDGNLYEARITLGRELVKLGRFDEALMHLARAAELAPNNPEPHYQMAIAFRRLGRQAEADRETAKVKEINSRRREVKSSPTPSKWPG